MKFSEHLQEGYQDIPENLIPVMKIALNADPGYPTRYEKTSDGKEHIDTNARVINAADIAKANTRLKRRTINSISWNSNGLSFIIW